MLFRKAAAASSSFYPPGAATNSLLAAHAGLAPPNHLGLAAYPPLLPPGGVSSSISGTPSVNTGSISSLLPPPIAPPLPPIAVGVGISPNSALNGGVKSQMKNSNSLRSPSGGGIARIGGSQKAAVSPANPSPNHLDLRKVRLNIFVCTGIPMQKLTAIKKEGEIDSERKRQRDKSREADRQRQR